MDNKSFVIECGSCGNKVTLTNGVDRLYTSIPIVCNRDFTLEITCENCENSIETE